MIERIKYLKNAIYKRGYYGDVYTLARIQHPDVIDILLKLADSPDIKEETRANVIDAMIFQDDPRGHELLIQSFQEKYQHSHNMLWKIGRLNDRRIIPTLINTLENLDDVPRFPRTKIINDTIRLLGTLQAEEAVPVLENILETYSFVSPETIMPVSPFAMYALEALHDIKTPEARTLAEQWDNKLDEHITFHLKKGTFLKIQGRARGKFRISQFVATRPDVIDYMLNEYDSAEDRVKNAIVEFLGSKLRLLESEEMLQQRIIDLLLKVAGESDDIRLQRVATVHLAKVDDNRVIPLALAGLDEPILRLPSVEILIAREYRQAIHKIIDLLEDDETPDIERPAYFNYLAMVGDDLAERVLSDWIYITSHGASVRRAFYALAELAKTRDSAFETICHAIDHKRSIIFDNAIHALRTLEQPALPILISLLELNDHRVFATVKALASPAFADAVPYLMPLLISPNRRLGKMVAKTLQRIGSESAFAALNAFEAQ